MVKTEIPTLLEKINNSADLTLDGFTSSQILQAAGEAGVDVNHMGGWLLQNAISQTYLSKPNSGNYSDYLNLTPESLSDLYKNPDNPDAITGLHTKLSNIDIPPALTKAFNKFGFLGTLIAGLIVTSQAGAAELNGDHEGALEIIKEWAVDAAGSAAGETVGLAFGGAALALGAVAGVTITAPITLTVVISASLLGGIFGADGANAFYELTKDKNANDRLDLIDKLAELLFGDEGGTELPDDLNGDELTFYPGA
ncbi:hypothetical protein [Methylocucumis oryzae]|uniref:hypothetical protein n=1 Tax=Methylocucumis oryzae TaxID=1632867 RepID=UPI0012FF5934|nr:hypothetical protein [Methylocucumis oryzae]